MPFALTRPEQGWSSLLLFLGMLVLLGVSVADSRPLELQESASLSRSLPAIMLAAGLIGFLLARSSLGVVRAHLIGALLAAIVLLFVAGATLLGQSPLPTDLDGISERISAVWMRLDADIALLIDETITTSTVTVYLVLGALCWTTAQFGAFSVFRYDRGGPAVMAVGTVLFLNVGLGSLRAEEDLLPVVPVLAIFAALALLLLMRLQLVQQRFAWARRHISDATDVGRLFIRTGVLFVLIAVVSASSLTVWATVDAQEIDIDALEEPLEDVAQQLSELLGWIGVPPPDAVPVPLGADTRMETSWSPGEGDAFTAQVTEGDLYGNYWWGKAEDLYDPEARTWSATRSSQREISAGQQLTPASEAEAGGPWEVSVVQQDLSGSARANLYRPPDVFFIDDQDVDARVAVDGSYSDLEYLQVLDRDAQVGFTSYVRDYRPLNDSITGNQLRATAGTPYPEWVSTYLSGGNDRRIIGPNTEARIAKVRAEAGGDTPYDLAVAVQRELRSLGYDPDLGTLCDPYDGVFTECLLAEERGFCQQYATTMVMMMRAMEVPARFVTGYLQGQQVSSDRWVVPQRALHNWVEVYFPDAGWVRFDPTPGLAQLGQVPTDLDDGDPIGPEPSSSPEPEPSEESFESEEPFEEVFVPPETSGPPEGGSVPLGMFVSLAALAGLLVAVVSGVLLYRLRRLPEGDDSLAYRGIVSLATRLGYGPHPSQTEYEYANTLSETIPGVREDLYVVTEAQVETAYGEQELSAERRGPLRSAYARIRTALLRLSLRWRR